MLIFAILYGGVAFSLSIFMNNSLKPLINVTVFALLVVYLFRIKILHGFIISIMAVILLVFFEIILLIPLTLIVPIEFIQATPWLRIVAGIATIHLPLVVSVFIIKKLNWTIKIPLIN